MHLPSPARAIAAERVGNRLLFTFTVPAETTDGGKMHLPLTASICRIATLPSGDCHEMLRIPVAIGEASASVRLPDDLTSGPPKVMACRVELLNAEGRGAGASEPVLTASGKAPVSPGPLTVSARRNSALITWPDINPGAGRVRVERKLIATSDGPVKDQAKKKNNGLPSSSAEGKTLAEATLTAPGDRGGFIDHGIHDGDTVSYIAERVQTLPVEAPPSATPALPSGPPGRKAKRSASLPTVELHSEPSAAVLFTFSDIIPPSTPLGLAAVPGGGFGQPPSIDLSWEFNPEDDVLGYNIYRTEQGTNPDVQHPLNSQPVPAPSYRDLTAQPGHTYHYRVSAIDRRQHESPLSDEVVEHLQP